MNRSVAFATRIPFDLKTLLDRVCDEAGLRKNRVIEAALREKLEDLQDMYDLREAIHEATAFYSWGDIKKELHQRRKKR